MDPKSLIRRAASGIREALRRYFVAGLLAFAPLGVTLWAILWLVQRLDNLVLPRVLELLLPGLEEPPRLPVVGALFTVLVIVLMGMIVRGLQHLFGLRLVHALEGLLGRVPVARSIYNAVKQLLEAIFSSSAKQSFRRVVLIEYPRKGLYAIAFTTGPARGIVQSATPDVMINCFVPTTPNPTSGFYLLVPEAEIIEVSLSVEEAFKLVMSAGLVSPESAAERAAREAAERGGPPAAVPAGESGVP